MLRILIGRSGSGKSHKCITEFNAYIQKNTSINNSSYLFVPEQYNMITERRLLEYQINENFAVKGLMGHEVLNFKRFVHRILSVYGQLNNVMLNDCGKIMMLTSVVNKIKSQLKFYTNLIERPGEIARILSLIDEFSKYNISYDQLQLLNTEDSYLNKKLSDISLIYKEYEILKKNKYCDENDSFNIMLGYVEKHKFFSGKSVWIDSFTGFTTQEFELIKLMLLQCENVTITLCTDFSREMSFECIDNTLDSLKLIAEDNDVQIRIENLSLNQNSNSFKYNNKSLFLLQQNISKSRIIDSYISNNINLTECESVFDEVTNCAIKINKLHNESNIPYENIAVALRETNGYDVIIKAVFQKYNIPFYIDDKKSINNNPLIKTVLSLLAIISDDWQQNDVLECIKTDMLPFARNKDFIESIVLSRGLKGKSRFKNSDNKDIQTLYDEINSLSESLDKVNDIKESCMVLCDYFEKWKIKNNICNLAESIEEDYPEVKNEYSRIWNILLEVLEQIVIFLGDLECSNSKKTANTLKQLLASGFSQYKIGFLPARLDSVQVINIERSRSSDIRVLFLLGVNEGVLPSNISDNGVLKDDERETLLKSNIRLADNNEMKSSKENFYIYTILSLPTDVLEISWPLEDINGKSIKPSHVVLRKLKKLFPNINIGHYKYKLSNEFDEKSNIQSCLDSSNIDITVNNKLLNLNGNLTTTVSRIEKYYKCPFSFLLSYGLQLKSNDEPELQQTDFGNLIHDMAENLFDELLELSQDAPLSSYEKLVDSAYDNIIDNMRFSQYEISQRDKTTLERVRRYAAKSFMYIKKQIDSGNFAVRDVEASFGYDENSKLKPLLIIPKDNSDFLSSIKIIGRIDRYDVFEDESGKQYVRIVDYKTSIASSKISENDIRSGINLQLITYLNAVINTLSDGKSALPAAALYYTFDSDIDSVSNHISLSKISETNKDKMYSMTGFVLDDENVINNMTGDNKYVISGNKYKSQVEFEELREIVFDNIEKASVNISKGVYPIKPHINKDYSVCDYCKMRSVCANCAYLLDESNS